MRLRPDASFAFAPPVNKNNKLKLRFAHSTLFSHSVQSSVDLIVDDIDDYILPVSKLLNLPLRSHTYIQVSARQGNNYCKIPATSTGL